MEPYEILALIGQGGMGEVYRASDTRLRREVAIKILKDQFTERFEREARAVAALNHTNLCHLYAVGPNYLVMELVEGETLRGPLPFDDALPLIRQLIDGIEAAHEKNIVHRDLKPANIKITPEGVLKILDFGLAKPLVPEPESTSQDSPTLTMDSTHAGTILGTAAYMAPEQARGKAADKRSDIWSFGVVVYELLTGKPAFAGASVVETLGAVINLEPDWELVPPRAQKLLKWCLEKDRKKRLQAIGDARRVLEEAPEGGVTPSALPTSSGAAKWLGWAVASVLAIAAAAALLLYFRAPRPNETVLNLSVTVPENAQVGYLALSPDGRRLAVVWLRDGKSQLYVRSLDAQDYHPLEGTDGANNPFWSPDSRFIGFFASRKLKTIPAAGGPATTLCLETGVTNGGSWNRKGVILFGSANVSLRRVNASGGMCTDVTFPGDFRMEFAPEFLPDGNHYLGLGYRSSDRSSRGVYLTSLDGMQPRRILNDNSSVLYTPPNSAKGLAHLIFLRGGAMMAQPFDLDKLEVIGDPVTVVAQASLSFSPPHMAVSVANGTLVYLANRTRLTQLKWFDRSGAELGPVGPPQTTYGVNLSPHGDFVGSQGRVLDLNRNQSIPSGAAPVWSSDETRIVFTDSRDGKENLFLANVNGAGEPVPLLDPTEGQVRASDWSRDGRYLIYTFTDPKGQSDIWFLPNPGKPDSKPVKFLATSAAESEGQLSPDGHWLAYDSYENNNGGVYLRPFPSGSGVSIAALNVVNPRWSHDGKELFFIKTGGVRATLMAVTVQPQAGGGLRLGTPSKLFDYPVSGFPAPRYNNFNFSPYPDGKRFLMNVSADPAPWAINVVTNWEKLLAAKTQ